MGTLLLLLVAAAVVAIYLLRPPPLPVIVPSNLVWRRLIEQRRPWRERLRWLLSLILALTIALSVALALSRAPWWSRIGDAGALVLVVDNAPSMATRGPDGRTRLQRALAAAEQALDELGDDRAVAVCDTTGRLRGRVAAGRWLDPATARDRLASITVSPSARRRPLAVPVLPEGSEARILFFTDGVAPPLGPLELRDLVPASDEGTVSPLPGTGGSVETVSVFSPAHNVGVTALELANPPKQASRIQLWLQVSHSAPSAEQIRLELRDLNGLRLAQTLELDAAQLYAAAVDATGWAVGPIEARVALLDANGEPIGDDLPTDDRAWTWNPGSGSLAVTLVSDRTLEATPLATMLDARPEVELTVVAPEAALPEGTELAVWDRSAPSDPPTRPALLIAPPARDWLPLVDEWISTAPSGWSRWTGTGADPGTESKDTTNRGWLSGVALARLSRERLRGVRQRAETDPTAPGLEEWQPLVVQEDRPVVLERHGLEAEEPRLVTTFEIADDAVPALEEVLLINSLVDRAAGRTPVAGRPAGFVLTHAPRLLAAHDPNGRTVEGVLLGESFLYDLGPGLWLDPRAGEAVLRRGEALVLRPDATLVDVNRSQLDPTTETVSTGRTGLAVLGTRLLLLLALALALFESWSFHRRLTV